MNFQQLRSFRELPRQGFNLSAVARTFRSSQPGVSRQMQDLEGEVGLPVFERKGNRITGLTEAGKTMLSIVDRLLDQADHLRAAGLEYAAASNGTLVIATTHTEAHQALPSVVRDFRGTHPKVRIALRQSTADYIAKWVLSGAADIGIVTEQLASHPGLSMLPCHRWDYKAVVPDGHPLQRRGKLTLAGLAEFPLITYGHGFAGRRQIDAAFNDAGCQPDIVLTAMNSEVIKQYVALGLGTGLLTSIALGDRPGTGLRVLNASHLFGAGTTWLVLRRGAVLRAYAQGFIRYFAPQLTRGQIEDGCAWPA